MNYRPFLLGFAAVCFAPAIILCFCGVFGMEITETQGVSAMLLFAVAVCTLLVSAA